MPESSPSPERPAGDAPAGRRAGDGARRGGAFGRRGDLAPARRLDAQWRKAIVLGLAVGIYGVSFGVLAVASGLSVAQAAGLSTLVFAGSSQFAAVGVVAAGGAPAAAVAGGLLLNARMAAFGLALMAPLLGTGARRVSALRGVAIALALQPVAPAGVPILAAALGVLPGLLVERRRATAEGQYAPRGFEERDG